MLRDKKESYIRNRLAEKIVGEIVLSDELGGVIRKWRLNFNVTQSELCKFLDLSHSVISDYENNKRKSPGTFFISKIVNALLDIDQIRGAKKIYDYFVQNCIFFDIHEFVAPMSVDKFSAIVQAKIIQKPDFDNYKQIYGYAIINLKIIPKLYYNEDFQKFLILICRTKRALIFTNFISRVPIDALNFLRLNHGIVFLYRVNIEKLDLITKIDVEYWNYYLLSTSIPLGTIIKILRLS